MMWAYNFFFNISTVNVILGSLFSVGGRGGLNFDDDKYLSLLYIRHRPMKMFCLSLLINHHSTFVFVFCIFNI